MIEIKAIPGKLIMLGKQGENLAREVVFDVSGVRAEFGDGAFRLSAKRPGESDAYPATITETGGTVVWALTGADTQNAGRGQCELAYYAGERRFKTWTYDTAIAKSLTGSPETDPYDEFLDEVNRLAAEAAISQREAKNSENAAKNSEENAKASENAAKVSEDNAAEYARAALTAEKKSEENAENATSAAVSAGQYAQNAATSATNAANSASAAETHEKAAKDAATAAAKSAEGLADAVKRAEDAAASAQGNAGKTAADREAVAGMKTAAKAAQDSAEKAATAAAGSATSARESATAAETARAGAAEIKTQIDEIKAEIDQAKTDIDQTKTDTLAAKTAAETAAATATEKAAEIADSAAQIATNTENIETNATDIDLLRRENTELRAKTDALWKLSEGKSYDFVEDNTEAYSKDVPTGCRFAEIDKIGGKTVARNAELVSAGVEYVEVQGANLLDTYPIPDAVKALPGYGWSAGNVRNEIIRRADGWGYVQRVGSVDLGTLTWMYASASQRFSAAVPGMATENGYITVGGRNDGLACAKYTPDTQPNLTALTDKCMLRSAGIIYIKDTAYTIEAAFKAAMAGVTLYYELATPITTKITDLMTGALPLMTTEPGGTITMHHALADDGLTIDVPSTVKYIRDLKEVASSESD